MAKVNESHEIDENGDVTPWMQDHDVYALYDIATDMRRELGLHVTKRKNCRIKKLIEEFDLMMADYGLSNGSIEEEEKATEEMVTLLLSRTRKEAKMPYF